MSAIHLNHTLSARPLHGCIGLSKHCSVRCYSSRHHFPLLLKLLKVVGRHQCALLPVLLLLLFVVRLCARAAEAAAAAEAASGSPPPQHCNDIGCYVLPSITAHKPAWDGTQQQHSQHTTSALQPMLSPILGTVACSSAWPFSSTEPTPKSREDTDLQHQQDKQQQQQEHGEGAPTLPLG
jgi:hypothetical protein